MIEILKYECCRCLTSTEFLRLLCSNFSRSASGNSPQTNSKPLHIWRRKKQKLDAIEMRSEHISRSAPTLVRIFCECLPAYLACAGNCECGGACGRSRPCEAALDASSSTRSRRVLLFPSSFFPPPSSAFLRPPSSIERPLPCDHLTFLR